MTFPLNAIVLGPPASNRNSPTAPQGPVCQLADRGSRVTPVELVGRERLAGVEDCVARVDEDGAAAERRGNSLPPGIHTEAEGERDSRLRQAPEDGARIASRLQHRAPGRNGMAAATALPDDGSRLLLVRPDTHEAGEHGLAQLRTGRRPAPPRGNEEREAIRGHNGAVEA